jgi:hypothetical protein
MLGGLAWCAACLVHNTLPQGCIGDQCDTRSMRGSNLGGQVLLGISGVLLVVTGVGLLVLARRRRPLARLGRTAGASGAVGLTLLAAAAVVSLVDNNWEGMPALVVPGLLLLVVGLGLVALLILRAGIVPRWVGLLLLVTALLLLAANEQTSRILLAVPFGAAWAVLGVVLLTRPEVSRGPVR